MDTKEKVHEITPEETYQIDSSEYDSDEDHAGIEEEEYEELVQEGMHCLLTLFEFPKPC